MAFKMQPAYLFLSLTLIAALLVAPASAAGGDTSGGILEAIVDWFLRWLPQPPAETTSGVPPPAATETQSLPQDPEPGSHAEMESPPQDQDPDPESTPDPEAIEAQPESRDPVLDPTPTPARVLGTVHTVDYRTVPPSGSAPLMVRFTAVESADFDTYAWDFGDGFSSTERDHFHTYTEPGTYTATLTVSNSVTGETTSAEMSIPVEPPGVVPLPTDTSLDPTPTPTSDPDTGSSGSNNAPLASPTVVPTPTPTGVLGTVHSVDYRTDPPYGSAPLMVRFTAVESADFGTYFWDFGDGFFSTERDHFHTYTDPGTYTATLTVSNSTTKWSSSAQMTIQVEPPGVVPLPTDTSLDPTPTPTSDPDTGSSGSNNAPLASPTVVPTPTPTGVLGTVHSVDYRTDPPYGSAPLMVRFTAVESADFGTYFWDFGDGFFSTERDHFHTYTDPGTYTATLTVSNSTTKWSSSAQMTIQVEPPGVVPLPTETDDPMTPVPTPTPEVTETPVPPTPDPTTPVPTVTEAPAEADPAPTPAQILGPVYAVDYRTDPPSGSAPLMVRFTAVESADFDTYAWDFGDGFSSTERNPFHTYTDIGTYIATLTVSNSVTGWNSTAEITVEVEPPGVVPLPTDEEGMMW